MAKVKGLPDPKIAERLRVLMRNSKNLDTQQAIAIKTGISQRTISRILNSEVVSSVNVYQAICEAFGVPLSSLTNTSPALDSNHSNQITSKTYRVAVATKNELLNWTANGKPLENIDLTLHREFLMSELKTSNPSHFIQVDDDSLLQELPTGCWAHVDCNRAPERGNLVEAKLKNATIVCRKYKPLTNGSYELIANNNLFDLISENDVEQILGVIVEWRVILIKA